MFYQITSSTVGRSIFASFSDGSVSVVPDTHPKFSKIANALNKNASEDRVRDLIDGSKRNAEKFAQLSERISLQGSKLYFDGDRLKGALSKHIIRMSSAGQDPAPFVSFMEKLATNPSEQSRNDLYRWLKDRDFTITDNGDFLAYKGVRDDGTSVHAGFAIRNGVEVNDHVLNQVGDVISMPRSQVDGNAEVACSTGLHAGTWEYASQFSRGKVLTVQINPRDVVSVPNDSNDQKLRVCRYVVVEAVSSALQSPVWSESASVDPDDCDGDYEDEDEEFDDDDFF